MGKYSIILVGTSREDLRRIHKSGDKALIKKVEALFIELSEHPYTGIGKPEPLRYLKSVWSRRIDKKNRIIYSVTESIVTFFVISCLGHYSDK